MENKEPKRHDLALVLKSTAADIAQAIGIDL